MSDLVVLYRSMAGISPESLFPDASPDEREARRLLSLNTPADTAEALKKLRDGGNHARRAEWYFLMGVCALRKGHIADAQGHLDHACLLGEADTATADAAREYRTLYEAVRSIREKRRQDGEQENSREHSCFSGLDCFDCCDCLYCCDCNDSDGCCDCNGSDGCCDCSDGCN